MNINRLAAEELCLEKWREICDPEENLLREVLIKNTLIFVQNTEFVKIGQTEHTEYEAYSKRWCSLDDTENQIEDVDDCYECYECSYPFLFNLTSLEIGQPIWKIPVKEKMKLAVKIWKKVDTLISRQFVSKYKT